MQFNRDKIYLNGTTFNYCREKKTINSCLFIFPANHHELCGCAGREEKLQFYFF
jgi:hypothetical protein